MTEMSMNKTIFYINTILGTRIARTHNWGFASDRVNCELEALYFYSTSVLIDSFVLRNPPERKARKPYTQLQTKPNKFWLLSDDTN